MAFLQIPSTTLPDLHLSLSHQLDWKLPEGRNPPCPVHQPGPAHSRFSIDLRLNQPNKDMSNDSNPIILSYQNSIPLIWNAT